MLTYNCLTCPKLSHSVWCISSVRTQLPGFVHAVNIQNKVYGVLLNTNFTEWLYIWDIDAKVV